MSIGETLNELSMNQNDNRTIYEAIRTIAAKVCKDGETYLRADLAYELKQYGIQTDSADVSRLALEAYRYFNNGRNIEHAFVTNDCRRPLIEEYKMTDLLDNGKTEDAMTLAQKELDSTSHTLTRLQRDIDTNMQVAAAKAASEMMDMVTGTGGAKEVRTEAATLFDRYSRMVGTYHEGEDTVRHNIADFTTLRTDIATTYQEYALKLVDIYGDSIKAVEPKLFDFGQVQFLDVDCMLKHTELEYNRISDTCSALISEISDSSSRPCGAVLQLTAQPAKEIRRWDSPWQDWACSTTICKPVSAPCDCALTSPRSRQASSTMPPASRQTSDDCSSSTRRSTMSSSPRLTSICAMPQS